MLRLRHAGDADPRRRCRPTPAVPTTPAMPTHAGGADHAGDADHTPARARIRLS
jgi:hypothetical protein